MAVTEKLADEQVAAAALQALQLVHESGQALLSAPGPKALIRRFGEALAKSLPLGQFDCLRQQSSGGKVALKRRSIKLPGVDVLSDLAVAQLAQALTSLTAGQGDWSEGLTRVEVAQQEFQVAVIEDIHSKEGTVLVWREASPLPPSQGAVAALAAMHREQLVRLVQNEARWLRKLDVTQARLYRDDLTGLYNYRYLEIALEHELRRAERFQNSFCLLFLDLDGFKPINDRHGHMSGSSVLKQVADVLRDVLREVDIPIRYGGDEFVVLLLGASCAKGVLAAERVRRRIEESSFVVEDGARTQLTASIGVAAYPEHARDMSTLLRLADETMYSSKRNGKNRVTVVTTQAGPPQPAGKGLA